MNKVINEKMVEANTDDFEITTATTVYSNEIDVGQIDSTKTAIYTHAGVTGTASGLTVVATIQSYIHGKGWVDTAVTWQASIYSSAATTVYTACTQAALGTRIRLELVSTGSPGSGETHTIIAHIVGKQ